MGPGCPILASSGQEHTSTYLSFLLLPLYVCFRKLILLESICLCCNGIDAVCQP